MKLRIRRGEGRRLSTTAYQTASSHSHGRFWDYDAIWDDYPQISRTALLARTCIARHADAIGQWIASYAQLADGARMSRRQAMRAAQELVAEGLLSVERRTDRQGRFLANRFRLLLPARIVERTVALPTPVDFSEGVVLSPPSDRTTPNGTPMPPLELSEEQQQPDSRQVVVVPSEPRRTPPNATSREAVTSESAQVDSFCQAFTAAVGLSLSRPLVTHLLQRFGRQHLSEKLDLTTAAMRSGRVREDPRAYWNAAVHHDWQAPVDVTRARTEVEAAARAQAAAQETEAHRRATDQARRIDQFDASLTEQQKAAAMTEAENRLPETISSWPAPARASLHGHVYRAVLAEWLESEDIPQDRWPQ